MSEEYGFKQDGSHEDPDARGTWNYTIPLSIGQHVADEAKRRMARPEYQAFTPEREILNDQDSDHPTRQYVTKDSGERVAYDTGMVRDTTAGKPRFDLIDPVHLGYHETMTYRHAMLMYRGAEKYGARNWEKASTPEEFKRFKESTYRHFMAWYHEEVDEDHAAAVLFNIRGAEMVRLRLS